MSHTTLQLIRDRLEAALSPTHLDILDDSAAHAGHAGARERPGAGHYHVFITSEAFAGKNAVARHRLVYAALGDLMHSAIHALVIDAKTQDET